MTSTEGSQPDSASFLPMMPLSFDEEVKYAKAIADRCNAVKGTRKMLVTIDRSPTEAEAIKLTANAYTFSAVGPLITVGNYTFRAATFRSIAETN